ncbi:MAG: hypothetical protein CMK32_05135 [Porticoccaceae bacterium]|nr:hypothetical protein [Porticoccaceae bacterium]
MPLPFQTSAPNLRPSLSKEPDLLQAFLIVNHLRATSYLKTADSATNREKSTRNHAQQAQKSAPIIVESAQKLNRKRYLLIS